MRFRSVGSSNTEVSRLRLQGRAPRWSKTSSKFDLGDSNLLLVKLREQATADAAAIEVEARLNFFDAKADYRAALASDDLP